VADLVGFADLASLAMVAVGAADHADQRDRGRRARVGSLVIRVPPRDAPVAVSTTR
jgi:hypothetical protein